MYPGGGCGNGLLTVDPFLLVATVVAVLTLWGAISYVRKYIAAQGIRGQLDAKDAIIETNKQTIDAFEARIETLEREVKDNRGDAKELRRQLDICQARYHELERYSAPQAVQELDADLKAHRRLIMTRLEEIESKLNVDKG
jgi:predicted ribosome quality control (RQC) complex YloA/Tae2 family protein